MSKYTSDVFPPHINGLVRIGDWQIDLGTGDLTGPSGTTRLEPKVLLLAQILAAHADEVVSRETLMQQIWGDIVVGDDSLARLVSKLRQALGDDARHPQYIETLSKRGYRLLKPVESADPALPATHQPKRNQALRLGGALFAIALLAVAGWYWGLAPDQMHRAEDRPDGDPQVSALLQRAGDAYFQFSRPDNEASIDLYTRVLSITPDDPVALAGLANALTQRTFRYPNDTTEVFTSLEAALDAGHLKQARAMRQLKRAEQLARRAVVLAPEQAGAYKALGFAMSAQGNFTEALATYELAIALDPNEWGAMINMGDVLEITGRDEQALPFFEQAYAAMARTYPDNGIRVRPWLAAMGVGIAQRYQTRGEWPLAEAWYRRVLARTPLHIEATQGLAQVLRQGGDAQSATRLCRELTERLGNNLSC